MTPVDASLSATLALGFVLGIGHALEPDRVAAVGTLLHEAPGHTA